MEIKCSAEYPERTKRVGARRILNYNIRELTESEIKELWDKEKNQDISYDYFVSQHKYIYNTLTIGGARWSYNNVVEAIIRDKYSADEMEAITNNMNAVVSEFFSILITDGIIKATKYLVDNVDDEKMKQFKEMQEWRAFAKKTAKEIFNNGTLL